MRPLIVAPQKTRQNPSAASRYQFGPPDSRAIWATEAVLCIDPSVSRLRDNTIPVRGNRQTSTGHYFFTPENLTDGHDE
jgi:hypothetical protein